MSHVPLRDILIRARQESARMRHHYLGVEHLLIALLEIPGGVTASLIEQHGLTAEYVVDAVRRKTGKGSRQRLWAGVPNTPRAEIVLGIANDLALENSHADMDERDLLAAILEEGDSVAVRALRGLGLDLETLSYGVYHAGSEAPNPKAYTTVVIDPHVENSLELVEEQLFILRRMFHGYTQARVERRLSGGYSGALLLVVTPVHADGQEDTPVVVKIDQAGAILDEARQYELYIKSTLPPLTARIEDRPTAPETSSLAGIRYTFVNDLRSSSPRDLRAMTAEWDAATLGRWIRRQLFPYFGKTWWMQRRMYRFPAWMEYDWLLPPVLTLEMAHGDVVPPHATVIKAQGKRARLHKLEYGDPVLVENFTVQKVYPDGKMIRLASGRGTEAAKRALPIDVRAIDDSDDPFFRGEVVERLAGYVFETRQQVLILAANALEPDFDPRAESIPGVDASNRLPNPAVVYDTVLDLTVTGSLSKMHGDLHLGNILVGPGDSPFLIDFALSREGHTLSDWAMLEVSLLGLLFAGQESDDWDAVREVAADVAALNASVYEPASQDIAGSLAAVTAVRDIAHELLQTEDHWHEYFIPLALCALRAITWPTMSLGARRLLFLVSALAMAELRRKRSGGSGETPSDDDLTDSGGHSLS